MRGWLRLSWVVLVCAGVAQGQWALQDSGTTASFRGVEYVGKGVAWVSGTGGTVLKTEDMGKAWVKCAVPEGAEKLDFRGVQAWDAKIAIVMSSGPGEASRLYKTVDGCATWKLVFTDPDPEGFFDALLQTDTQTLYVLGDSVKNRYPIFVTKDAGTTWLGVGEEGRDADADDGAFAASNTSMASIGEFMYFGIGGSKTHPARVYRTFAHCVPPANRPNGPAVDCTLMWTKTDVPMGAAGAGSGVFSLAGHLRKGSAGQELATLVAVGGSYEKPNVDEETAATSEDGGKTWSAAAVAPGGYRSAVAYDKTTKRWITVGPNGTDVSMDDGRNWSPLKPGDGDPANADQHWNALSLPLVVGEKGRIGILRDGVLESKGVKSGK